MRQRSAATAARSSSAGAAMAQEQEPGAAVAALALQRVAGRQIEVLGSAELDDDAYELVRKVLFDFDEPGRDDLPKVDPFHAGVLLEVLKDLLYQAYVRRGRLQQAMMVRRYFAEDAANVTPLPGTGA